MARIRSFLWLVAAGFLAPSVVGAEVGAEIVEVRSPVTDRLTTLRPVGV